MGFCPASPDTRKVNAIGNESRDNSKEAKQNFQVHRSLGRSRISSAGDAEGRHLVRLPERVIAEEPAHERLGDCTRGLAKRESAAIVSVKNYHVASEQGLNPLRGAAWVVRRELNRMRAFKDEEGHRAVNRLGPLAT